MITSGAAALVAAGAAPPFFGEVAALLVASAAVAYLCHRLGVTPIVSFLLTGAVIGPQALGLVDDPALIDAAAEVGVVLLLFTIGIEFSLGKLAGMKRLIFLGGGLQVGLVVAAVGAALAAFGIDWRTGVFTGCLVALSSTAIVMKLLMNRRESESTGGRAVLAILIFQDLAVVAMVLVVPMLGGGGGTGAGIGWALAKAGAIVALVVVVARRVMPRVLEAVARTCSQEIFVLSVMAICFGTAYLTSLAGVSLSLGAFLAGLVVSESRFSDLAFGEIQPLQILFSATFFVSIGLLLDLRFLVANLPLVLALVGGVLVVKALAASLSVRLLGYRAGTALFAGLITAQVGEFSFVLERTGREMALFPAGMAESGPRTFIAATVVLMMVTPLLAALGARVERRLGGRPVPPAVAAPGVVDPGAAAAGEGPAAGLDGHVVIAGYGRAGRLLADALDERRVPYLILTLSPDGALEAERLGRRVLRGNYARRHELSLAGLDRAQLLVVADDDLDTTRRVVRAVRAMGPGPTLLAATRFERDAGRLRDAGADLVTAEEVGGATGLVAAALGALGVEEPGGETETGMAAAGSPPSPGPAAAPSSAAGRRRAGAVRLTARQRAHPGCPHAAATAEVVPSAAGCEECLALGDTWAHLRICMGCGHVGCCDESKNKHATEHYHSTGHPVVRSLEPGESWAWCYTDQTML